MRGDHPLGEFVATQVPISISSGESEFYALLRAAVEAKFLKNLVQWLEFDEEQEAPELVSDAVAALGARSVSRVRGYVAVRRLPRVCVDPPGATPLCSVMESGCGPVDVLGDRCAWLLRGAPGR